MHMSFKGGKYKMNKLNNENASLLEKLSDRPELGTVLNYIIEGEYLNKCNIINIYVDDTTSKYYIKTSIGLCIGLIPLPMAIQAAKYDINYCNIDKEQLDFLYGKYNIEFIHVTGEMFNKKTSDSDLKDVSKCKVFK